MCYLRNTVIKPIWLCLFTACCCQQDSYVTGVRGTLAGYNSIALKSGDECPPLELGRLRIYGLRFSSYAHRVYLVLQAKQINAEIINIDLKNKPEWLWDKNPIGKVPIAELDNKIVYESAIIAEWLDSIFPGIQLLSFDPYERANQKMMLERLQKINGALNPWVMKQNDTTTILEMNASLKLFEDILSDDFFGGSEPTFVDYMQWPFLERVQMWIDIGKATFDYGDSQYPKLTEYIRRMRVRPEGILARPPLDIYPQYIEKYFGGQPDFNIGLETNSD